MKNVRSGTLASASWKELKQLVVFAKSKRKFTFQIWFRLIWVCLTELHQVFPNMVQMDSKDLIGGFRAGETHENDGRHGRHIDVPILVGDIHTVPMLIFALLSSNIPTLLVNISILVCHIMPSCHIINPFGIFTST